MWYFIVIGIILFALILLLIFLAFMSSSNKMTPSSVSFDERYELLRGFLEGNVEFSKITDSNKSGETLHIKQILTTQSFLIQEMKEGNDVKELLIQNGKDFAKETGNNKIYTINMKLWEEFKPIS